MPRKNTEKKQAERTRRANRGTGYDSSKNTGSATCDRCGATVPARADTPNAPMAHYDRRVPNAHISQTYCK